MKTIILAIGKKTDADLARIINNYQKRLINLRPSWQLVDAKLPGNLLIDEVKKRETSLLLKHIRSSDYVILLDERGSAFTSPALAERLQALMNQGIKRLVFVIGGAYGVSGELFDRADIVWSLSDLVFPHQLVRLILIEQLYRSQTILNDESYHHN